MSFKFERSYTVRTTVGHLTLRDVGRMVTVEARGATVSGLLRRVDHDTDWIAESRLDGTGAEPVAGRTAATLQVGGWEARDVPLDATVEMLS